MPSEPPTKRTVAFVDGQNQSFLAHILGGKIRRHGRQGVHVYSRSLRYRNKRFKLPDGREDSVLTGEEKGTDVRIAIDVIQRAHRNRIQNRGEDAPLI